MNCMPPPRSRPPRLGAALLVLALQPGQARTAGPTIGRATAWPNTMPARTCGLNSTFTLAVGALRGTVRPSAVMAEGAAENQPCSNINPGMQGQIVLSCTVEEPQWGGTLRADASGCCASQLAVPHLRLPYWRPLCWCSPV
jgi:hypothetical protein